MKWEYFGTGLALIGIGITLIVALPPPWWPKMPPPVVHAGILLGAILTIGGIALAIFGAWSLIPAPKYAVVGMVLFACGFVACAGYFLLSTPDVPEIKNTKNTPKSAEGPPEPVQQDKPWKHTLEDLFKTDFPDLPNLQIVHSVTFTTPSKSWSSMFPVTIRLYQDFRANVDFIGLYIPSSNDARDENRAYEFIKSFRDQVKTIELNLKGSVSTSMKTPGENPADSRNFVFSGRVFVYTRACGDLVESRHALESLISRAFCEKPMSTFSQRALETQLAPLRLEIWQNHI